MRTACRLVTRDIGGGQTALVVSGTTQSLLVQSTEQRDWEWGEGEFCDVAARAVVCRYATMMSLSLMPFGEDELEIKN